MGHYDAFEKSFFSIFPIQSVIRGLRKLREELMIPLDPGTLDNRRNEGTEKSQFSKSLECPDVLGCKFLECYLQESAWAFADILIL